MKLSSDDNIGTRFNRCEKTIRSIVRRHFYEDRENDSDDLVRMVNPETSEADAKKAMGMEGQELQTQLHQRQTDIDAKVIHLSRDIREAAYTLDSTRARDALGALLEICEVRQVIADAVEALDCGKTTPTYAVSSLLLHDSRLYLMQRDVESLHFVTGMQLGNILTLDKMVTVGMSHQTPVSASGDTYSTHRALIEMERYGHKLHACFHSHPGTGAMATMPSSVDLDYQARQENGGYTAIGGIFSRDGYFRAFSLNIPFRLLVYGKGVERIDDKLYRLTDIN